MTGMTLPARDQSDAGEPLEVVIKIADTSFVFRPTEVTARIARRVRQETGMSLLAAQQLMGDTGGADIDVLATICFAAALQTSPNLADLEAIDESLSYATEVTVEILAADAVEDGNPET